MPYDDKGRWYETNAEKESRFRPRLAGATTGASGAAAHAAAQKAKPKVPKRTDFASDEAYSKAYKSYRESMLGDTDTQAQKRALGRMK